MYIHNVLHVKFKCHIISKHVKHEKIRIRLISQKIITSEGTKHKYNTCTYTTGIPSSMYKHVYMKQREKNNRKSSVQQLRGT